MFKYFDSKMSASCVIFVLALAADICTSDATLCSSRPNEVCVSLDLGAHECVCREFFEMLNGECTGNYLISYHLRMLCMLNIN